MLQLTLRPQKNYNWFYTATGNYSEYAADTSLFGSLGSSYNDTTNSIVPHLDSTAANIPNGNWQAYHQTGASKTSLAPQLFALQRTQVGAAIPLPFSGVKACGSSATAGGNNGIYQRVYNLQDGKNYNIEFTVESPASPDSNSIITLYDLTSNTDQTFTALQTGVNTYSLQFEADGNTADVVINIFSTVDECFYIKKASVQEHYSSVDYTFSDFADGSVEVDLFDDHIPLTLSVSSFTDATSNTQSYSKDFQLPSTKNNDKVFTHIYDLNTTIKENVNAFNPYIKTIATLKEDGVEVFTGELTLRSINKNTEGITYDVNLQSRASGLAEVLKSRKIKDLDFSSMNHEFTSTNIKNSWTTGLELIDGTTTNDIKYPFVDWIGNVGADIQGGEFDLLWMEDAFRPFIRIKHLFDKIFSDANFGYESSFINSDAFTKLFMDFNHGEEFLASSVDIGGGKFIVEADQNDSTRWFSDSFTKFRLTDINTNSVYTNTSLGDAYWDSTDYSFKPLANNTTVQLQAQLQIFNQTATPINMEARTIIKRADGSIEDIDSSSITVYDTTMIVGNFSSYSPDINEILNIGDELYFETKTVLTFAGNVVRQEIASDNSGSENSTWVKVDKISSILTDMSAVVNASRGDISQWDFVKSIMNMFNLIIYPNAESPTLLNIEPYDSVFDSANNKKDWSNKVDVDSFTMKMMELSRRVNFSYVKDDNDHAANVYSNAIPPFEGIPYRYGDESVDKGYTSLVGVETVSAKPFASTIVKPLNDYQPLNTFFCPAIYNSTGDSEPKAYKNKARILYDNGVAVTGASYSSPDQNDDVGFSNESEYLQFTHFSSFDNVNGVDSNALDLNFGQCQSFVNNESNNTLVNEYWSTYYAELYHEDTRVYSVNLYLDSNDISNFEFTDIIVIDNSEFRVNNINYNAGGMSKIELIKLT